MSLLKTCDEILELDKKATPGPWRVGKTETSRSVYTHPEKNAGMVCTKWQGDPEKANEDMELISLSRNNIAQMAEALKEARELFKNHTCTSYPSFEKSQKWLDKWDEKFKFK